MGKQRRRRQPKAEAAAPAPAEPGDGTARPLSAWIERPWFAPALFALVALVYFWEFPLSGKIIFGHDVGMDFHKGKAPVWEKLRDLEPSAWDPRMGGYPISEEIRHKFFPTYLIELFTTRQRAIGWRYLLAVFGAGWGMFLYLRQIGVHRWAALWGGLAFLSAPTFLSFPYAGQYAKMTVIALFPFLCLCVERGMDGGRRAAGWWALLALLIALGVFSPHLQMLQYALLGMGLYFLYKLVALYRQGAGSRRLAERAGLFALAAVLGLGLGAEGVYPPYLHVKTQSKRAAIQDASGRSEAEQLAHAQSWSLHPEEMASLVVPEFGGFDDPTDPQHRYWGRNAMKLNSEYFGILALMLALVAVPQARRRLLVGFLCGLFVLVAAFTLGGHTPVHWLAYHLVPGGKVLRTIGMAAFLFAFPACVLAALTLDRVLRRSAHDVPVLSRQLLIAGGALTGLALLTALAPGTVTKVWTAVLWSDIPDTPVPGQAGYRQLVQASAGWLSQGALIVAVICAAGTALAWLHLRGRLAAGVLVLGLAGLTVADTWRIDRLFLHYEDPARWPDFRQANPRTVRFLEQQPGRFRVFPIPGYGFLSEPQYHLHGADVVTAFNNYTLRRYDRLLKEFQPVEAYLTNRHARRQEVPYSDDQLLGAIRPLLNLVSARYLVTPQQISLQAQAFPEAFASENVRLYENPTALPWVQLVPHAEVLLSEQEILLVLRDGRVDPRRTALLEEPVPLRLPGVQADLSQDRVTEERYDYHEGVIRLRVRAGGPRLLVINDNDHPQWQASVDGQPAPILRANYVWKAVPVAGGDHLVELTYHSAPVARARAASVASGLLIAAGLGWSLWRRRRSEAGDSAADEAVGAPAPG